MAALLIGVGEARVKGEVVPAAAALEKAGIKPLALGPKEGLALLNGTQVSCALALSGAFRDREGVRRRHRRGRDVDRCAQRLRHAVRCAASMRCAASRDRSTSPRRCRGSWRERDPRIPPCAGQRRQGAGSLFLRCQPQVMGAVLDIMRQAARTLEIEAMGVTDNPLVLDNGEVLSGGNFPRRAGRVRRRPGWPWLYARSATSRNAAPPSSSTRR